MREWLSGGAPPCQGGGRGFDPRLALTNKKRVMLNASLFFYFRARSRARRFDVYAPVRADRGPPDLVHRLALLKTLDFSKVFFVLHFMLHRKKSDCILMQSPLTSLTVLFYPHI